MAANNNSRKRYWIDSGYQGRFMRMILSLVLITLAFGSVLPLIMGFVLGMPEATDSAGLPFMFAGFAALLIVASCYISYISVRVSHRVCGPLFRIDSALDEMKSGRRPGAIKLRKGDELGELVYKFNETVDALEELGAFKAGAAGEVVDATSGSDSADSIDLPEAS